MEKYLDPNRPFKCEVCKESFTQKNILLVHYNSVSHLHRLKKSLDGQGKSAIPEAQPTPEKTPTKGSALEALLGNLGNRGGEKGNTKLGSLGTEDEEYKPFKCNICKVAYAQGSTLDIHVRSVLHQTKASKLQELILSGQIDMNKPLIEQPDALSLQEQHKKMISDMLSPKSLNSTGSSGPQTSPTADNSRLNRTSSPSQRSSTPQSSPLATMMMNMKQQQQGATTTGNSSDSSPPLELPKSTSLTPGLSSFSPLNIDQKGSAPSPVLKNLLQNYGIDFSKQFGNNKLSSENNDNNDELVDTKSEKDHRATPGSVISNGPADRSHSRASASEPNENGSKTVTPQKVLSPPENTPAVPEGLQEALRNAMMNAQLQQTLNNPLMMQMAQLSGGVNPLMAMNLHPPLIPPNLLKQGSSGAGNDNAAAMIAQMFGAGSSQPPLLPQQLPTIPPGMDPKLFALMQASRQKQVNDSKDPNENKNQLAQMMNILQGGKGHNDIMGQFQPDPQNLLQLASKMGLNSSKTSGITLPQSSPGGGIKEKQQQHVSKQHSFTAPPPPGLGGPQIHPGLSSSPMPDSALLMQQQAASGAASQQNDSKRARTRISDDQLKILRSNFDINNSPAEDALNKMAQQTGLPLKVIKHWFRNTLFKERQKNKDSPYNFNNPPSTKLNLEEYEKTGESKVTPLNPADQAEYGIQQEKKGSSDVETIKRNCDSPTGEASSIEDVKNEMKFEESPEPPQKDNSGLLNAMARTTVSSFLTDSLRMAGSDEKGALSLSRLLALGAGGASMNSSIPSLLPNFPAFPTLNIPPSTTSAFPSLPVTSASFPKLNLPSVTNSSLQLPASPVMPDQLNSMLSKQNQQRPLSPQSVSSQGKRANRTRFTDYQIKVLQEFFENNAYPKDDDLEYLSKLLGLSPRVIVVWFQNARQKARKVYENQPADGSSPNGDRTGSNASAGAEDEAAGRFTRTSSCNYQCKKCLLVFQRYYELIRHQKQHCYKEEDAKKSAQAQKAAAQAAAQFQGNSQSMHFSDDSNGAGGIDCERGSITSPACSRSSEGGGENAKGDENRYSTEDRMQSIQHQRNFEVEEAISKLMHPLSGLGAYPTDSPFGILQQQGLVPLPQHPIRSRSPLNDDGNDGDLSGDDFLESESGASSGGGGAAMTRTPNMEGKKRKHSLDDCEDAEGCDDLSDAALLHKDKRLRTTILPEQLDFLYQKYQIESNPSRKMLEQIAGDVGLRKRVVQVWFQNTRARERKGHFRPSQQFISKRCPFCSSVFKVKAALEAHLTSKHPDQPTSIVDIDALPNVNTDGIISSEEGHDDIERLDEKRRNSTNNSSLPRPILPQSPFTMPEQLANLLPTGGQNVNFDLQNSMRKYYEDTMKRFMNDLGDANKRSAESMLPKSPQSITSPIVSSAPVDLTATYTFEDSIDDHHMGGDASDSDGHNRSMDADGNLMSNNKRFRTQMSGLQIKMMKAVFEVYKTPTMTECSNLGKDIGLQKRVVQVWFQNARAKEKRAKLQLQQATGGRDGDLGANFQPPTPDRCIVCPDFSYVEGKGCAVQDHIFTRPHLENLKVALEQGRYEPEAPGTVLSQAAAAISGGNNGVMSSTSPPPSLTSSIPTATRDGNALQMLQMATQSASKAAPNSSNLTNELMEMSSMQNGRMLMQV